MKPFNPNSATVDAAPWRGAYVHDAGYAAFAALMLASTKAEEAAIAAHNSKFSVATAAQSLPTGK